MRALIATGAVGADTLLAIPKRGILSCVFATGDSTLAAAEPFSVGLGQRNPAGGINGVGPEIFIGEVDANEFKTISPNIILEEGDFLLVAGVAAGVTVRAIVNFS